jgi:hypothetical protein
MGAGDVLPLAAQLGIAGVLAGYIFWKEKNDRQDRLRREVARDDIDKAEISSREKLASSLTMLAMVIQGKPNV